MTQLEPMSDDVDKKPEALSVQIDAKAEALLDAKAAARARSTANLVPIQRGQTLNPGGRPRGIRRRLADLTNDGEDILAMWVQAMKGSLPDGRPVKAHDSLEVSYELANRLWGKAVETQVLIDGTRQGTESDGLPPELLAVLARALLPSQAPVSPSLLGGGIVDAEIVTESPVIPGVVEAVTPEVQSVVSDTDVVGQDPTDK